MTTTVKEPAPKPDADPQDTTKEADAAKEGKVNTPGSPPADKAGSPSS